MLPVCLSKALWRSAVIVTRISMHVTIVEMGPDVRRSIQCPRHGRHNLGAVS
jgi:hypothetical protein